MKYISGISWYSPTMAMYSPLTMVMGMARETQAGLLSAREPERRLSLYSSSYYIYRGLVGEGLKMKFMGHYLTKDVVWEL